MASMICAAALARPASIGAHQRLDEPQRIAV
jgi:succinate dehydrogenase/fumarate reductase flavoprotein subunit